MRGKSSSGSRFSIGNSVICTMNNNYRIAATLYSLETWVFRNISVSTCIKETTDDDDDHHHHHPINTLPTKVNFYK
jgi:hypothetical protein